MNITKPAAVLVVILAGCGGNSTPERPLPAAPTTQAATAAPADKPTGRCLPVSPELATSIASGLLTPDATLRFATAVKSNDHANVYMVAADIQAAGLEGTTDVGVWATSRLDAGKGPVFAVDAVAKSFSTWGPGDRTEAKTTGTSDAVKQSEECTAKAAGR